MTTLALRPRPAMSLGPRTAAALVLSNLIGLIAFIWPFVAAPSAVTKTATAPIIFGLLLLVVLALVLAQFVDKGMDTQTLALLGVLSAVDAALRPLGAGVAGIEPTFFLLILAGRVFGPAFGFTLGCTSLFASALLTGGVGPWMPYQMFASAWAALFAGFLPQIRGRAEIWMLACYGFISGYVSGFMLNLSFWPFAIDPHSSIAYLPGASFGEQWLRFFSFDATTSLGWDTGRAITSAVLILLVGSAILGVLRRAAVRARFA